MIFGIKMVKKGFYNLVWSLGLISGIVCMLFAIFAFLGYMPDILDKPIKGITGMTGAVVLGFFGFLILGAARMTKARGKKANNGGILLVIFGVVAYFVGGSIGSVLAILAGLLIIFAKYI